VISGAPSSGRRRTVSQHHNSSSDTDRNTASVRVLTPNLKKMCLTCDFTVSGEISRARAMRLLERPWLIIARTSRSRAVSLSLPRLLSWAEWSPAERACHRDSKLAAKGGTSPLTRASLFSESRRKISKRDSWTYSSRVSVALPLPRTPSENAADLCFAHELHYAEPPSNRSSIERKLIQICVSARPPAKLVAPVSIPRQSRGGFN